MSEEKIIAKKNKNARAVFTVKIVFGVFLSAIIIAIVWIFRNKSAFINGRISPLDFMLLLLVLTVRLAIRGVKGCKNYKIMPSVMLTYKDGALTVLGEDVSLNKIRSLKGAHEFGHTGTVIIVTDDKTYNLYSVQDYANVIKSLGAEAEASRLKLSE